MSLSFVDVNGLAGFLSYGFTQEGFKMSQRTGTLDFGSKSADANRHLLGDGWEQVFSADPQSWPVMKEADLVVGCPPCSGWSPWSGPANRGNDAKAHDHTWAFIHYAARVAPSLVIFESVQQAYTQGRANMVAYRDALEQESGLKYDLHHVKMNNLMVGGFSYRPRYFWVAARSGLEFRVSSEWPDKSKRLPTIMDVIGDLQDAPHSWSAQPYTAELTEWAAPLRSQTGMVDGHIGRKSIHSLRISEVFDWLPGGNAGWAPNMDLGSALRAVYAAYGDLPPSWDDKKEKIVARDFNLGFTQPYRWSASSWANVLTGGALDLVIHPTQPRGITHREAARIQGLPDDWLIEPVKDYGPLQSTWGKAVSAHASRWVASAARTSLEGDPGSWDPELIGDREWLHDTDKGFSRQAAKKAYYMPYELDELGEDLELVDAC